MNAAGNNHYSDISHSVIHNDSSSLIMDAKKELQKEKALLAGLKNQQTKNSNSTRDGEVGEVEETENGQESMSEDESDDDSDRKGIFILIILLTYTIKNVKLNKFFNHFI